MDRADGGDRRHRRASGRSAPSTRPSLPAPERAQLQEATSAASESAFRTGLEIAACLVALGGIVALVGVRTPAKPGVAADCAGGQLAGAPLEAARAPARASA